MTGPLNLTACGDLQGVRAALREAGYTSEAVAAAVKPLTPNQRMDIAVVKRRVGGDSPFDTLVRMFVLGHAIEPAKVVAAIGQSQVDVLTQAGVLCGSPGPVRSAVKLIPYQELCVTGDFGPDLTGECARDHVLGVGAASVTLANLTPRGSFGSALDVGTGAGIQALLASAHSGRVLGTDTNPRALNLAEFNARLNGRSNIAWREGGFFDPVPGETFDLVVSNPPFVISPESRFVFRDGDVGGDGVSETVVRGAAAHLAEQGFAVILINWHHQNETDWDERPRQWVKDLGCDTWILCFDDDTPLTYAARWLGALNESPAAYESSLSEWMRYYEQAGMRRISAGVVIMRKVTGRAPWIRANLAEGGKHVGQCGDHVRDVFRGETFLLACRTDHEIFDTPFSVSEHVTLHHGLRLQAGGGWVLEYSRLKQTSGLAFSGDADAYTVAMLGRCCGDRPLKLVLEDVVREFGGKPAELAPFFLEVVKKLVRAGMLIPAGAQGSVESRGA